jgi:hypothetical protein
MTVTNREERENEHEDEEIIHKEAEERRDKRHFETIGKGQER